MDPTTEAMMKRCDEALGLALPLLRQTLRELMETSKPGNVALEDVTLEQLEPEDQPRASELLAAIEACERALPEA